MAAIFRDSLRSWISTGSGNIVWSLPHATEQVQWEDNLVFKVGGKMFAVAALEPDATGSP